MNCYEVEAQLDNYIERELAVDERAALEGHLESCSSCQHKLVHLRQVTALLYRLPAEEPAPNLATRIVAMVEDRVSPVPARWLWFHTAAIGLGILVSMYLLLTLGYQTLLAWQQGGAGQFISLLFSDPELIARYPAESLYAVLESLPVGESALTLGLSLVTLLLVEQLASTLTCRRGFFRRHSHGPESDLVPGTVRRPGGTVPTPRPPARAGRRHHRYHQVG